MRLTITYEEQFAQVEVDAVDPIENLKAIIEAELNVPMNHQVLVLNGRQVTESGTVGQAGIGNDDLIVVVQGPAVAAPSNPFAPAMAAPSNPFPPATGQARAGMSLQDIPANCSAELLIEIMRLNPQLLRQIESGNPSMAAAIKANNVAEVRMLLMKQAMEVASRQYQQQQELKEIEANPFSEAAQAKIEEAIRLGNVQQNMEIAMEEMPEAFGRVSMLYIPTIVNGTPVKAFVDSGAQSTIMSSSCAERCGIMRLVDRRYAGQAVGVGTAKILGRVHMAELKIGNTFYTCSFSILDQQGVDLLFGLDMLKRFQCCIDLHRNLLVLRNGTATQEVPFLPEHEIPGNSAEAVPKAAPVSAPSTPAPAPAPVAAPPTTTGFSAEQTSKIEQLSALGFPQEMVIQALQSCNWNVDIAAGLLFEN
ncbi:DNA damage-inducible protein 1 [Thraustotheca clavata]|uniref:DNA damage-inducible protein 1 n=1 Tax=Thraustotheca clavata TaxID=74557 RepID=A0A1W0A676_9STRA|nr:DNA damage-inducible protein 1 [Thraustotheca clavata]